MRVQSLGQEDPLKKGMATCSSILTLKPYGPVAWWVTGHGVAKSQTRLSDWAHTRTQKIMRMILVSSLLAISEYSVGNMVEHVFKQADRWRILIFSSKTWKLSSLNTGGGSSVQFSSVAQSCLTLCDPMNCSTPGLSVYHQLPEFTQTHVHRVSDVIQPSHPLSSSSPPTPNPSQHQGLLQWVNSSHQVAKVLEL